MSTATQIPRHRLPIAAISADLRVPPLSEGDEESLLQVGDLAKAAGKTVRAIPPL